MARKLRAEYPGALYHVMNRGDGWKPIFKDDADRRRFLVILGQACAKTGWRFHAWCLIKKQFHLVVQTPKPNLVAGMKWFSGVYTGYFNRRHRLFGPVFTGRYKALIVDGGGGGYLKTVCDYVHLHPVRARLIPANRSLARFPWSSYPDYLRKPAKRPPWLNVEKLLREHGIAKDSAAGRRKFELRMEQRRAMADESEWKAVRRGWCLGGRKFRKELLAQMKKRKGEYHYGEESPEADVKRAERIVREELKRRRWRQGELARRRKGDPEKVKVARRLRKETTMTLDWIAQRLKMGVWTSLSNKLRTPGRT